MSHSEGHHDNTIYYKIFGTLAVLTVVTVLLNKLSVGIGVAIILALIVATLKASLVVSFFMHFIHEKGSVYFVLASTVFFVAGMFIIIIGSNYSVPEGTVYLESKAAKPSVHQKHHGTTPGEHSPIQTQQNEGHGEGH